MTRKKLTVTLTAVISAVVVLLSGTLAWQNINQTALNEASDIINPGGRLHDDFDGENKDIYVENFAEEPIFVRVQLGEYMALTNNKGIAGAERENIIIGGVDANGDRIYIPHLFGNSQQNKSDAYWTWTTGGQTVYMPTFNKNKDSLQGDVNGTYAGPDGSTEEPNKDRYDDYISYAPGETKGGQAIYDADANSDDEVKDDFTRLDNYVTAGSIFLLEETHEAKTTLNAGFISMTAWLSMVEQAGDYDPDEHGYYWVYDDTEEGNGWVYWSAALQPDTATGLLLDKIKLHGVMDDSWYYAIQVTAQFVTADDIGKIDSSGFYDPKGGTNPSANAEKLLELITGETLN